MAGPPEDWRLPEKRSIIIKKLEEAYSSSGNLNSGIQQTPQQVEQACYEKSKNREEYNRFLQQVLLRLARAGGRRPGQVPQPGMSQGIGQTGGTMMQQGGMGMNPQNPNYNQSQYSQYPGGVRPGSMQGGDLNMGGMMQPSQQPPGYSGHPGYPRPGDMVPPHANQSFTQMRMPNQPIYNQGPMVNQGNYGGVPPGYNMHSSGGMMRGGVHGIGMGRPGMGMSTPVQNPASSFVGVHSVQAINNPSYAAGSTPPGQVFSQTQSVGMQPSSRPEAPPTSAPITSSSTNDQSGAKEQQSIGNPPTPHPPTMQGSVPSPAPPTPLLPASPATSGVGSPAQQPSITPEENEVYMRKLAELQKYIPLLQKWISRLTKEDKNNQLPKLKQLYSLLSSSNKRVPITTLMRCGEALDKMFSSEQSSRESHSSSLSDPSTLQTTTITPHADPVVPQSKLIEPQRSPSLLEFKRVPSPPSDYESLLRAIHTRPLPAERLPPTKRMCNRDEPSIPFGLTRELATISNVKLKQLPNENRFDKSTILQCTLDDDGLCSVPPLKVRIPSSYPLVSPVCDLSPYHAPTCSSLVSEVGRTLSERLSRSVYTYSLSSLLSDWEMCVLRAMAKQLSTLNPSL